MQAKNPSLIVFGDSSFEDGLLSKIKNSNIEVRKLDSVDDLKYEINGSEIGVLIHEDSVDGKVCDAANKLQVYFHGNDFPIFACLPEHTPPKQERKAYASGVHLIIEWPRESEQLKELILGLHLAGPLKTRSEDRDAGLERAIRNRIRAQKKRFKGTLLPTVYRGIVMLGGQVTSMWDKVSIKKLIENVPGVKAASMTSLKVNPSRKVSDVYITKEIQAICEKITGSSLRTLDFTVSRGSVKAIGTLPSKRAIKRFKNEVSKITGVKSVFTSIDAYPKLHWIDKKLSKKVRDKVFSIYRSTENIQIAVHHGTVVIRGAVKSMFKSIQLENAALSVKGVRQVNNNLRVSPYH